MKHLDLLHRARNMLLYPSEQHHRQALIEDLNEAITGAYPKRVKTRCYCGEEDCCEHSEFEVGDG